MGHFSFKLLPSWEKKPLFWEKNLKIYWLFFNSRWSIPEVEVCFPSSSKLNAPIFHLGMTFLFFCIARILFCKVKIEMKFFEVLVGAVEEIFCVRTERTFKHLNIWESFWFSKTHLKMWEKPEIQERFQLTRSSSVRRSALRVLAQHVPENFTAGTQSLYLSSNNSQEELTAWNAPGSGCWALMSFPVFSAERQLGEFMGCPAFPRAAVLKCAPKSNWWGGIPRGADKFRSVMGEASTFPTWLGQTCPFKDTPKKPEPPQKSPVASTNRGQAPELAILFKNNGARWDGNYFNTSEGCQAISFSFIDFFSPLPVNISAAAGWKESGEKRSVKKEPETRSVPRTFGKEEDILSQKEAGDSFGGISRG